MATTTNCSLQKNISYFSLSFCALQGRASRQHLLDVRTSVETVLKGHRINVTNEQKRLKNDFAIGES